MFQFQNRSQLQPKKVPSSNIFTDFKVKKPFFRNDSEVTCSICKFDFPTKNHLLFCRCTDSKMQVCDNCYLSCTEQICSKIMICPCCLTQVSYENHEQTMSHLEKQSLSKLQQFRMVIPNLLYVIGIPKKYGQENTVRMNKFFGQYGKITRVLINNQTKDYYEQQGQCAVYIWYESIESVAIALKCLNGLRIGQGTLKCSFGTSKYCMNFLKEAHCDSKLDGNQSCPFIHKIERRRDKVIQDDFEFKDWVQQQDKIVENFMAKMNLRQLGSKNEFYKTSADPINHQGLPSPGYVLGQNFRSIKGQKVSIIEFMKFDHCFEQK